MPARRFCVTVFLGLAIVAAQTFGQAPAAAQQLILTRASLGPLPLEEGMVVSLANVRTLFPSFDVTQSIGGGESGDYPVIRVGAAGARLFSIVGVSGSSETASEFPVAYLVVESPQIADEHGCLVARGRLLLRRLLLNCRPFRSLENRLKFGPIQEGKYDKNERKKDMHLFSRYRQSSPRQENKWQCARLRLGAAQGENVCPAVASGRRVEHGKPRAGRENQRRGGRGRVVGGRGRAGAQESRQNPRLSGRGGGSLSRRISNKTLFLWTFYGLFRP